MLLARVLRSRLIPIRPASMVGFSALAIWSTRRTVWAPAAPTSKCVSEACLTPRHHALAQGRYATMAERGKAGAVLIGARVTGAASPGFDVQIGRPVSRGHTRGSPTAAGCGLANTLETVTLTSMWMLSKPAGNGIDQVKHREYSGKRWGRGLGGRSAPLLPSGLSPR